VIPDRTPPEPIVSVTCEAIQGRVNTRGGDIKVKWTYSAVPADFASYEIKVLKLNAPQEIFTKTLPNSVAREYTIEGLPDNSKYTAEVKVLDKAGNYAVQSASNEVTLLDRTPPPGIIPAIKLANVDDKNTCGGNVEITWKPSGVADYYWTNVRLVGSNGTDIKVNSSGNSYTFTGLKDNATYWAYVQEVDKEINIGPGDFASSTVILPDRTPPSPVSAVTCTAIQGAVNSCAGDVKVAWTYTNVPSDFMWYKVKIFCGGDHILDTVISNSNVREATLHVNNLDENRKYTAEVTVFDKVENYAVQKAGNEVTLFDRTPPPMVTKLMVKAIPGPANSGLGTVQVTWVPSGVKDYSWTNVRLVGSDGTDIKANSWGNNYTFTGLKNGIYYWAYVQEVDAEINIASADKPSEPALLPDTTPPSPVASVSCEAIQGRANSGGGDIKVKWDYAKVPDDFAAYQINIIKVDPNGNSIAKSDYTSNSESRELIVAGLKDNTKYTAAVLVKDKSGNFASQNANNEVSLFDRTPPPEITPTVTAIPGALGSGLGSVQVNWQPSGIKDYSWTNVRLSGSDGTDLKANSWGSSSYTFSGLKDNAAYRAYVQEVDGEINFGPGDIASNTVTLPDRTAPKPVVFSQVEADYLEHLACPVNKGKAGFKITWQAPNLQDADFAGYRVILESNQKIVQQSDNVSALNYTFNELEDNTTYLAKIAAVDKEGNSSDLQSKQIKVLDYSVPEIAITSDFLTSFHPLRKFTHYLNFTVTDEAKHDLTYIVWVYRGTNSLFQLKTASVNSGETVQIPWNGKLIGTERYALEGNNYRYKIEVKDPSGNSVFAESNDFTVTYLAEKIVFYYSPENTRNFKKPWQVYLKDNEIKINQECSNNRVVDFYNYTDPSFEELLDINLLPNPENIKINFIKAKSLVSCELTIPVNYETLNSLSELKTLPYRPAMQQGLKFSLYNFASTSKNFFSTPEQTFTYNGVIDFDQSKKLIGNLPFGEERHSLIIRGYIKIPETKKYKFKFEHDDAVRLWFNGSIIYDKAEPSCTELSEKELEPGLYPFILWYWNVTSAGKLKWSYLDDSNQEKIVPAEWFYTDDLIDNFFSSHFRGVRAHYYYNLDNSELKSSNIDKLPNKNWGGADPALCGTGFSSYINFKFLIQKEGTYKFKANVDDDLYFYVDSFGNNLAQNGQTILAVPGAGRDLSKDIYTKEIYLTQGLHNIHLFHVDKGGNANLDVKYQKKIGDNWSFVWEDFKEGEVYLTLGGDQQNDNSFSISSTNKLKVTTPLMKKDIDKGIITLISPSNNVEIKTNKPELKWQIQDLDLDQISFTLEFINELIEVQDTAKFNKPDKIVNLLSAECNRNGNKFSYKLNWKNTLSPGNWRWQVAANTAGGASIYSDSASFKIEPTLELEGVINYPNPFKDETKIRYKLSKDVDDVKIYIFTVSGDLVKELSGETSATSILEEYHDVLWDGKNEYGQRVVNGVYIYKICASAKNEQKEARGKMLKLK
ncbi:MAG: fibronectin type III domain-containing protein, partial [Candidatus Margulisiibacteriota bacterium]